MNKRIRSRVLAAAISSTLVGSGILPVDRVLLAQDKPTAPQLLERGQRLFKDKNYADAKKLLLDIDPSQLSKDEQDTLTKLLKDTDLQLADSHSTDASFDAAQADLDGDKLAAAAAGFQKIADDAGASAELKDKAKLQLALTRQKQADKAPQMKELLAQATELLKQDKLDEAQADLNTVMATGADLGWQDNAKPAQLQQQIMERRTALAQGNGATTAPAVIAATAPAATEVAATPAAPVATEPMAAATEAATAPGAVAVAPVAPVVGPAPVDPSSPLGQTIAADQIERQRALTLYNIGMKRSSDAINAKPPMYGVAVDSAHDAAQTIDDNRQFFSDAEGSALKAAAAKQQEFAAAAKASYDADQQKIAAVRTQQTEEELAKARLTEKRRRVDALMRDAKRFVDTQQYKEAADTLRQIRVIDPTNTSAELMLTLVNDRINYREFEAMKKRGAQEYVKQSVQNEEQLVPYADLMIYPENWIQLTRVRNADSASQETPVNRAIREKLEENVKEISADQQGFEKVINFLKDNTGTNIFVNWKALEAAGIDRNTPLSVSLRDVSFRKALNTILAEVGGGTANLGYTIDDGVITISTRDDLNSAKYQTVRVFDIRDLLVQPDNNIQPPNFNLQNLTQSSSGGSQSGGSLFQDNGNQTNQNAQQQHDDAVKSILDTIKSTVAPDSWRDNGGTIGSVRELNGQLIVNQTLDNQTAVNNLLEQLRETRSVQISIEARIMFVANAFFDQFGLNWDLSIPAGEFGGNVGAISVTNGTSAIVQALPASTGVPNQISTAIAGNSGLSLSGSILNNWQLSLVMQATQADTRTVNVDSPRVTLFNGQKGYIAVTQQQNYISNFNQTTTTTGSDVSAIGVSTNITVSTLVTGVVLFVEATVSADRRYVVMKVAPQISTLDGISSFGTIPTANQTGSFFFVQLPRIDYTTVNTMVSVPDGGTLLIGGQKLVGESETEVGVPILSKIPGLNRLFTNRQTERDERMLLILLRPKIIIQKEIENGLYGPGFDKPTGLPNNPADAAALLQSGSDPGFSAVGR